MSGKVTARIRVAVWPDGTWSAVGASENVQQAWRSTLDEACMEQIYGTDAEHLHSDAAAWCWVEVELVPPEPPMATVTVLGVTDER